MGVKDTATISYLRQNEIFADAFNYFIYDGEQVIDPDSLEELDTREIAVPYGGATGAEQPVQRTRIDGDVMQGTSLLSTGSKIKNTLLTKAWSAFSATSPTSAYVLKELKNSGFLSEDAQVKLGSESISLATSSQFSFGCTLGSDYYLYDSDHNYQMQVVVNYDSQVKNSSSSTAYGALTASWDVYYGGTCQGSDEVDATFSYKVK